jgi:hypothetical protein
MSEKLEITETLWATKATTGMVSLNDYDLWREIDGSDTLIGRIYQFQNGWEIDSAGETYIGSNLTEAIYSFLGK